MSYKGKFIVVSGIDGCGKTSIISGVSRYLMLKNIHHIVVNDPDDEGIAGEIRTLVKDKNVDMLNDTMLGLITSVRYETIQKKIIPALTKGMHVISHRWVADSKAYQDRSKAVTFHREICDNLQPDYQIILEADVDVCIQRLKDKADADPNDRFDNSTKKEMEARHAMFTRELFELNTHFIDANRPFPLVLGDVITNLKQVLNIKGD